MHFAKPSLRRALWSIVIVFVVSSVIAGIAVAIGFIVGKDSTATVAASEYVRLVVASLTIWGPMYLLIAWQVSIPAIIGIGVLAASIRRGISSPDSGNPE
ncbi:hypothetical protein SAMN02799620_01552 [Mycolicibacterium fluoranthenivorans]|uniref:Uncharacterized protein n=2 Tax=Mycolicibacterium fluoranthenivorans TaxID=258505 RepID=A0A1G4VSX8_9MYCO|nr:hypothetical protein SAMN02799620_01552 [Mycolicibacterium fluoranthenivorans]